MDKFRRGRKTTTPSQQILPATSSSAAAGAPSTSSTKFTIEQKVTAGTIKKGPYSVKRSVDPNDILIKRRPGEGSKPLFSREDICVNRSVSPKKKPISRASSSDYSSPEDRNRHQRNSSKSKQTTSRNKSPEKVPYFLDQTREKDRIKRVYGSRRSRSLSPQYNRRRSGKPRSRSRTPPTYRKRKSYERRTPSRDRYRPRYRSNYCSRSRSRSRDRRRTPLSRRKEDERHSMSLQPALPPPVTQYIPIPVPVEYPYMQPSWGGPMMPPQPRFPYPMRPAMPPPMPYMLKPHRPPRYIQNAYQRGHFRPRQY